MFRVQQGDGDYELVPDVMIDDYLRERINVSVEELSKEKECVKHLFGEYGGVCEVVLDTSLPGEA